MPNLRDLQLKDTDFMYEWMSDSEVTQSLMIGRTACSKEMIQAFIRNSWKNEKNVHFAIVTDEDEYVGTVSLKNISKVDRNAEYAIAIRKKYWGMEYATFATTAIVHYGFQMLNLHKIYLNVPSTNSRAIKFYEKFGFQREGILKEHINISGQMVDLFWYCILNGNQHTEAG